MKKYWFQTVSILLNIILLFSVGSLTSEVNGLRSNIRSDLRETEETIENRLDMAVSQMKNEMAEAAKLHMDYGLEPTGLDADTQSLLADAFVELKEWGADTAVTLLLTYGGKTETVPMLHEGNGRFTVPVALATGGGEVRMSMEVTSGGVTTKEDLGGWGDLSMLLPVQMDSWGWSGPEYRDGTLVCGEIDVSLRDAQGDPARVRDAGFSIYVNGEWKVTGGNDDVTSVESMTLEGVEPGDEVAVTFACRDEFGLHYEFSLYTWTVEETDPNTASGGAAGGSNIPILTWE